MKEFKLSFSFKGARQYIQGPDIFNECFRILEGHFRCDLQNVEFVIHRMTGKNLVLFLIHEVVGRESAPQPMAQLSFQVAGQRWCCELLEHDESPVTRNLYDESLVVDLCEVDTRERNVVLVHGEAPFSVMETLVSMNKAMHQKIFPNILGSWVFCRWSSPVWPIARDLHGVRIQLVQALGTRLTRSVVSLKGQTLGDIYFSARPSK